MCNLRLQFLLTVFVLGSAGCGLDQGGGGEGPSPYVYHAPEQTGDGWQTATLANQGMQTTNIVEMVERIRSGEYTGINSVLLVRGRVLILEEYFGGFARDSLHSMRSASKAITSALVGITINLGHIDSVDVPLLSYFPEYEGEVDNWDERKRNITVEHVLSMTSGIRGNEDAMYPTDDWIKFYLDQPMAAEPGAEFSYATSGVVAQGNVITRASGLRIPAFADRYLFGPLGISEYRWPITNSRGSQGLAMTGGGLNLRPRDMAKFGQLYLNEGTWAGERLISEEWIHASTRKQARSDLYGEDFGYLWRMIDRTIKGREIRSFEAWGNGGQFIMVFPALELVAVPK